MTEKEILLENIDPIDLYGSNNAKINLIKTFFPKLKIIPRGSVIKAFGSEEDIEEFDLKIQRIINHFERYQSD